MCRSLISRRTLALLVILTACTPEPTPFPVDVPATPASTAAPTAALPATAGVIRYALAANTAGLVADLPLLEQSAQVITLETVVNPADLGSRYDIIAAYGDLPGGQRSPVEHQVALVFNPDLPPTNDNAVVAALKHAVNPTNILTSLALPGAVPQASASVPTRAVREALANAGWPDGFDLTLAVTHAPGAAPLAAALARVNVTVRAETVTDAAFASGAAQLALVVWTSPDDRAEWEARIGAANVFPLYTLPISYLAVPGLTISYTPTGWPLPGR
ncbi:MAG: hypothetical protein HZC41_13730 [Chloroflexi bacterium]|nr:hypothetical protein [Chloroflexota bacterium]